MLMQTGWDAATVLWTLDTVTESTTTETTSTMTIYIFTILKNV